MQNDASARLQIVTRWASRRPGDLSSCQPEVVFFLFVFLSEGGAAPPGTAATCQTGGAEEEEGERRGPRGRPSAVSHQHPGRGGGGDPLATNVALPAQVA